MAHDTDAFRRLLRHARLGAGLTQEALAERAGLSVRGVQNLERGDRRPYPDTTARLVNALDLQGPARDEFEDAARRTPRDRLQTQIPNNLPVALTECIGRGADLESLAESLARARLVTLVGPGGAGKTRLALQFGRHVVDDGAWMAGGVWLVELGDLADEHLVPQAVAAVFGVREETDRPLQVTLADALQPRDVLIILDNCEHLHAASARLVGTLLRSCPRVRVLATSRQPLGAAGEVVQLAQPLEVPPEPPNLPLSGDPTDAPDEALRYPAVRLFVERAQAALPGFTLDTNHVRDVIRICRQLDGVPLALELAAARLRALAPNQLADHLERPFGLLSGSQAAPKRQQSLRGAMDWSYDLLEAPDRQLLRALSVFAGGWTLAAAEEVCGQQAAAALWRLVDQSLVQVDWRPGGEPRYRLLETVRQYAAERLEAQGDAQQVRDRHIAHFLQLAEQVEPLLRSPEQVAWLARLDLEHANLRAALGWALARPHTALGLRLTGALGAYWHVRGERSEGLRWLEPMLRMPLHSDRAVEAEARARALVAAARLAVGGDNQQAAAWLDESLALSRQAGDRAEMARARLELGRMALDRGDDDHAEAELTRAHALAEAVGSPPLMAAAFDMLGQAAVDRGDHATGLSRLEASLALSRRLADRGSLANALRHLAMCKLEMGDVAGAAAPLEEALWLHRELGDAVGVAWALHDLARVALEADEAQRAASLFSDSLRLFRRLGHTTGAAWTINGLGRAAIAVGQLPQAASFFDDALALFERLQLARGSAWTLYNLGWIASEAGQVERARGLVADGFARFQDAQLDEGMAACLIVGARLAADIDPLQAARWFGAAMQLRARRGQLPARADRQRAEAVERTVRARLGDATFEACLQVPGVEVENLARRMVALA